jgi:hypothetical protein
MDLTNPARILRRLAGRLRAAATEVGQRSLSTKLVLMAVELEQAALEQDAQAKKIGKDSSLASP